jgi:lipopolysaccharide export system protein LptA
LRPFPSFAALLLIAIGAVPALAQKVISPVLPGGDSKAPVSIDAAKLEYFDKEQKLVYSGGVVAKQGDAVLKSTTLVIFLNSGPMQGGGAGAGENQIKRMEASGPVTIVSKDQVGVGDRATYDKEGNKVLLIGNVSLSQGGNIIKGKADSRLIYDLITSQAIIEGAGGINSLMVPGSGDDPAQKNKSAGASPARQPRAP